MHHEGRGTVATALLAVLALLAGLSGPAGAAVSPTVGAPGVGDPYFPRDGNGGIDVRHYDVRVAYDFSRGRLTGRAALRVVPTQDLSRFNLDLLLPTTSVTVAGQPATFRRAGHELVITPKKVLRRGQAVRVVIDYGGVPGQQSYLGENAWLASRHEVVTMGQPHMSPWWFPANDHPSDKATFSVRVTVPHGKEVVSNGRLVQKVERKRATTWHWRARDEMATYLAFFAAGDFTIERGRAYGHPYVIAVSDRLRPRAKRQSLRQLRHTPRLVAWLEKHLGPYPFETTGGVVTSLPVGFALENQTRPTYPRLRPRSSWLLVHELAHQWWGDSVSVRRWSDIWLNEGVATFMEVRYTEATQGFSGADWLRRSWAGRAPGRSFWSLRIGDPSAAALFDVAVYERGAMTLQALRQRVGERNFWRLLRTFTAERRGGHMTSAEFEAAAEEISGQDLSEFFEVWLRTPQRPALTVANGLLPPQG